MSGDDTSSTNQPARLVRCPRCGKQTKFTPGNPYRPFCSERCKMIDLGAWADGTYAIPAEKNPSSDSSIDDSQDDSPDNLPDDEI